MMIDESSYDVRDLYVKDYFGKTIDEILMNFPFLANKRDILFQYLYQSQSTGEILSIIEYRDWVDKINILSDTDKQIKINSKTMRSDEMLGFIDLMHIIDELIMRYMCMLYYAETWFSKSKLLSSIKNKKITYKMFNHFYQNYKNYHYMTPSEYEDYLDRRISNKQNFMKQHYFSNSLYDRIFSDDNFSMNEKYKEILDKFDAQFCYNYLNNVLPNVKRAKLTSKQFLYENMFDTTLKI